MSLNPLASARISRATQKEFFKSYFDTYTKIVNDFSSNSLKILSIEVTIETALFGAFVTTLSLASSCSSSCDSTLLPSIALASLIVCITFHIRFYYNQLKYRTVKKKAFEDMFCVKRIKCSDAEKSYRFVLNNFRLSKHKTSFAKLFFEFYADILILCFLLVWLVLVFLK